MGIHILGTGSYLPETVVENEAFSAIVDTSDEWIVKHSGIHRRHFQNGPTYEMAVKAGTAALEAASLTPDQIDLILCTTVSGDYDTPAMACVVQGLLGAKNAVAFDINAACAGFLYGTKTAHALLADAPRPYAIVVGAEVISRVLDHTDRNTCVLFGDGAGAAVIARDDSARWHTVFGSRGDSKSIWVQGPGPEKSAVHMEGKAVFRFATEVVEGSIRQLVAAEECQVNDLDLVVCHQANARIIDFVAKRLKAREGLFYKNMEHYGNTSAASIPMALDELVEKGLLKPGMRVLTVGFGGGLTWAGALFTW